MSQLHLRSPKTEISGLAPNYKSGLAPNYGVIVTAVPHSLWPGAGPAGRPGRGHARWHGRCQQALEAALMAHHPTLPFDKTNSSAPYCDFRKHSFHKKQISKDLLLGSEDSGEYMGLSP